MDIFGSFSFFWGGHNLTRCTLLLFSSVQTFSGYLMPYQPWAPSGQGCEVQALLNGELDGGV